MQEIFSLASLKNFKVEIHFQGRKINKAFYSKNPEYFTTYPTAIEITERRNQLLTNKEQGIIYTLVVCEDGMYVIES